MSPAGRTVRLSDRLRSIADLVTEGSRIADIGTDHAYLPIALCREGRIPSAIASDLREGPLAAARENIRKAGLEDRILLRLSDGLSAYRPGEAETLILAGMGGRLICRILTDGQCLLDTFREILLQPQSEIASVRVLLAEHRLKIVQEACTEEDGKYYPVILAVPVKEELSTVYSEDEVAFGPCLLAEKDPVIRKYLTERRAVVGAILTELQKNEGIAAQRRVSELKEEERLIRTALQRYEM